MTAALGALLVIGSACGGASDGPGPRQSPIVLEPRGGCERDLATGAADVTVFGAAAGDFLADRFSLATGDFNDDGFADILVGAPLADGLDDAVENAGEAYVVFGGATPPREIDLAQGAPLTLRGEAPGDNLGFTVAAGDVNGDGIDDVLVGARFASEGGRLSLGKVYVVYGRPGLSGEVDTAAGAQDVTIIGARAGDFLSVALAAGDVNGDGVDDILLGASGASGVEGERRSAGQVAVVLGGPDLPSVIDLSAAAPHFTAHGAGEGDNVPNHLAAGDVNGDGSAELIVGAPFVDAPNREDAGRVYVLPVPAASAAFDLADAAGISQFIGSARKDLLGFQVAAGDVNGDGLADVVAGARDADGPADALNNAGEVHVFLGRRDGPRWIDLLERPGDTVIYGSDPTDSLGFAIAVADFNDDGLDDILAGVPLADSCLNERVDAGEAYVIFSRQPPPESITLKGAGDLTFFGAEAGDGLGFSVAAGDFNGDGRLDVVLGALLADGPDNSREDAGEVYVIFGR
jgi:hypothetical protein